MRTTQRFLIICAISLLVFAAFVVINQRHTYEQARIHTEDHSRVIANSLWTFEESSALAYLNLAANSYGYEWIMVKDDLGKTFLRIEGPPPSPTDAFLIAMGLIRRHTITADIRHDDRTIGTISVLWLSRTIYTYLYVLLTLTLFLGGVWMFLRILDMNRHLESRVLKRTAELEEALGGLRDSEEKYRTLVENIPGAVLHSRNDEHWTPLFASDSLEEITGYSPARFFSGDLKYQEDIVHPDDSLRVRATIADALGQGSEFNIEYRIIDAEGQQRWVSEKGQGVSWREGRPEYFTSAIFDITHRKLAEEELMRLQNLLQGIINSMPSTLVGVNPEGPRHPMEPGGRTGHGHLCRIGPGPPAGRSLPRPGPRDGQRAQGHPRTQGLLHPAPAPPGARRDPLRRRHRVPPGGQQGRRRGHPGGRRHRTRAYRRDDGPDREDDVRRRPGRGHGPRDQQPPGRHPPGRTERLAPPVARVARQHQAPPRSWAAPWNRSATTWGSGASCACSKASRTRACGRPRSSPTCWISAARAAPAWPPAKSTAWSTPCSTSAASDYDLKKSYDFKKVRRSSRNSRPSAIPGSPAPTPR